MRLSVWIAMVSATITTLIYIAAMLKAAKDHDYIFEDLPDKEHPFKCIYPLGYVLLEKLHFPYDGKYAQKKKREISIILGKKYADYFLRVNMCGKAALVLLCIPVSLMLYGLLQSPVVLVLFAMLLFLSVYYFDMQISDVMKKRDMEISRELPNIISKLTLLVNAGMILREAWTQVAQTGDTTLYEEMKRSVVNMNNGMSESEAYKEFGDRCQSGKVKKFVSTLEQNVTKGNKELVSYLKEQAQLAWTEKKEFVRQQGETASSKLLIPIGIMFIGILLMVIVPVFANFSL